MPPTTTPFDQELHRLAGNAADSAQHTARNLTDRAVALGLGTLEEQQGVDTQSARYPRTHVGR